MKKIYYTLAAAALAPAIMLSVANSASAQRRNTTSHDIPPARHSLSDKADAASGKIGEMKDTVRDTAKKMYDACHCNGDKHCIKKCDHKKHNKDMSKKDKKWKDDAKDDITTNYNDALEEIEDADLTPAQKDLLIKHAKENRDLMMQQMKERRKLFKKQMQHYKEADFPFGNDDADDAIDEVNDILNK